MYPFFTRLVTQGVFFSEFIRKLPIKNFVQRHNVERLRICLDLHSKILNTWLSYVIPPMVLAFFCTIVVTSYVTLRHTGIPVYLYVFFPFTGATLMSFIFLFSYDAHSIVSCIDGLTAALLEPQARCFQWMRKAARDRVMKRAKAFRPFIIPLGPFGRFSLNFPIDFWEEVLNYLMLLLSF